ncbi:MAG: helix-turn-helix transcriptional regulator, partial [Bryobacteraceae bacterium]
AETDRALRLAHGRAFADWLGCSLPEQAADLSLYLSEHRDGNVLTQLESWRAGRDGLCLVPKDALEVDRSLFESDLKMVLQLLGGGRSTPKSRRRQGSRLQAIFNLLESADVSRLTIEEVAAECALSANWFRQWCRQNTGSSFHGLVRQVQMRRAAHLLRTTVSPAAEVAAEIGYQHPPNFCRDFKTMFRITPHQYRRLWRGIKARWFRSPDGEAETSKENHQI